MSEYAFLEQAYKQSYSLAQEQHWDQRYGEKDYFDGHVLKVVIKVRNLCSTYSERDLLLLENIAVLHDVLEDCCDVGTLQDRFIPQLIIDSVVKLTKEEGETLEEYITKVKGCEYARLVKMSDALCNLEESLISGEQRRIDKYLKTLKLLTE